MDTLMIFWAGAIAGCGVGYMIAAFCFTASEADRREREAERQARARKVCNHCCMFPCICDDQNGTHDFFNDQRFI